MNSICKGVNNGAQYTPTSGTVNSPNSQCPSPLLFTPCDNPAKITAELRFAFKP